MERKSALWLVPALLIAAVQSQAADPERGQKLYDNHCLACHESTVHVREIRRARNLADIRYQIERWHKVLNLSWTQEEVDDVLRFLNVRYYRYVD